MKFTRRTAWVLILLAILLMAGILFRTFLYEDVVRPFALVIWLLRRIVLSVDQVIYWNILLFIAVLSACLLLLRQVASGSLPPEQPPHSYSILEDIDYWRTSLALAAGDRRGSPILQHNLAEMLAALYASRQADATRWEIQDALQQGRIPLPADIHAFLFPPANPPGRRSLRQALQDMIRRWSGRDADEYLKSVEHVLTYMESMMEIKHDRK